MDTIISAKEQIVGLMYQIDWSAPNCLEGMTLENLVNTDSSICCNLAEMVFKPSHYNYTVHTDTGYIIYNTLFNSLGRLDEKEYDSLCFPQHCDLELQKQLIEQGFLLPQAVDEVDIYYRLADFLRQGIRQPLKVILAPTMACNARCFYCYEAGISHSSMSEETVEKITAWIEKNATPEGVKLVWFGGEPLLDEACIDRISTNFTEKGIDFSASMITNGSLFCDENIPEQIERWHLHNIQITIDGDENEYLKRKNYTLANTNYYQKLMTHIRVLAENKVYVSIRLNIDRNNVMSIYRAASEIETLFSEYPNVSFYPAFLTGSSSPLDEEEKVEIIRGLLSRAKTVTGLSIKNRLHGFPRVSACDINSPNVFAIDSDGDIYSCERALGRKSLAIGSVRDSLRDNKRPKAGQRTECKSCVFLPKCFGGCHSAYVGGESPCFEIKYMIKAYLELL